MRTTVKITLTPHPEARYLHYAVNGLYSFDAALELFHLIRQKCTETGFTKAFVDIRGLTNDIPQLDRYRLGEQAARIWGGAIQVAVVGQATLINHFFEDVVVNRQSQVRVYTDPQLAYQWLAIVPD